MFLDNSFSRLYNGDLISSALNKNFQRVRHLLYDDTTNCIVQVIRAIRFWAHCKQIIRKGTRLKSLLVGFNIFLVGFSENIL